MFDTVAPDFSGRGLMFRDLAIAAIGGGVGSLVTLSAIAALVRYGVPFAIKRFWR